MEKYNTQQAIQAWRNPVIDDVVTLPPPAPESASKNTANETNLGFVVTAANLLVTAIIITAMLVDGQQAGRAILVGAAYFAITMTSFTILITGTLSTIVASVGREKTERLRIEAYRELGESAINWRIRVEDNRAMEIQAQALPRDIQRRLATLEEEAIERSTNVDPLRTPSTYIAPYSNVSEAAHSDIAPQVDTTAQEAVAWLRALYDDTGEADRSKLQSDGRLKIRMLGSSRGPGSREAGLWLINKGVIRKVPGGFALNLKHYPTRESVRNLY